MMDFYKAIENGYIIGIGTNGNDSVTEITEAEYNEILSLIHNRPTAQDGFIYKLKAGTLEWELVELPPIDDTDEEATESDYIDALNTLGVTTNEEN